MAHEDFDIPGLAEYLHLSAAQVQKMADRAQVPGRRIGGQWRFSPAEIHHWLEERIGASDEGALTHMEGALQRDSGGSGADIISVSAILPVSGIAVPLLARTRNSVISAMVELAVLTGFLWDPEKMAEAVRSRENLYPTSLETGVALLHPRRPRPDVVSEPFLALGITPQGIPFGSQRGSLTDVYFLICSTDDRVHLRVLARLSRLLAQPGFLSDLRSAPDPMSTHQIVADYETQIVASAE